MRRKFWLSKSIALLTSGALCVVTLAGCASQKPRRWDGCALAGAVLGGAAAGGIGLGVANAVTRVNCCGGAPDPWVWTFAAAGAALGTLAGHYVCDPVITPPPPPPSPPPPPPPPTPPPPPPAPPAKEKIVLRGAQFDFNKYNIRPDDAAVLDEAAATLKAQPRVAVNVDGYCDAIGSEEYNLQLSQRRAEAVVNYLVGQGIPESRLNPHGYGKTGFVATNETAEGRAQNRRVELMPTQ